MTLSDLGSGVFIAKLVTSSGSELIPDGSVRPEASLGLLDEPLAAGGDCLFDLSNTVVLELANPSMTLESVGDAAMLGGANRAMVGGELLQFGEAEIVGAGKWRLSRLLRGRAGTDRKSTRLNSSHYCASRMPSSA